MKKLVLFFLPLSFILLLISCQKEVSVELNGSASGGTLQSDAAGECLPKTVQGIYKAGTALVATENYIDVQVNVAVIGNYRVFSDTVNGISFQARGSFTTAGLNTVRLNGTGTPVNGGISNFFIRYDSSQCLIPINIIGSNTTAGQFTLPGAPNSCMNYVLNGDYKVGIPLTTANTVLINVNVTALGTYSLATPVSNGMTFTGSGSFTNLGQQVITLTATGTPGISGSTNIPVTVGTSVCGFEVVVTSSVDYFPRTEGSNWSYQYDGNPNDSLFLRAKSGTVTFAGNIYTVFEAQEDLATGFYDFGYYRRAGGDYHTYADLGEYFGLDSSSFQDYIFLKDDVVVNTTWQTAPVNGTVTDTSGTAFPVSVRIQFTLEQKDVAVTVGGTSYPNTIVVVEKYQVFDGANWVDATALIGYIKNYFARGVGLIKLDYYYQDGNPNPPVDYVQDIRRYQVF
ncbi:MAG: hypothetical protein ACSLE0_03600 [Chitinophagaceae bacterium]